MASDEELMKRAAGGDMDAFGELVARHQETALNVAYRFLGDPALAEDTAQEAFLKILAAAGRYRASASFRTYLYNVVWHLCVDSYRKKQPVALEPGPEPEDPRAGPERAAMREERARMVRRAIGQLPARQRMALVLKNYEELSYDEIGRAMGCSRSAVDSLLVRARRALAEQLRDVL